MRKLEIFFIFLIMVMALSFMTNMFAAKPDYSEIAFGTFVPTIPHGSFGAALGLIGAVIMPHNLYFHSQLVLTRKVENNSKNAQYEAIIYNCIESAISLFIAFIIGASVIITFAVYTLQNPD